ncbi:hypothetical protein BCR36DRAFT_375961 [Piromyces finnis]|uniref:Uncharacterized protein n=1 Tax=Piromyces finnis TaxID=1754191 RepID=A0A1Y1U683_9FUNG|nr:hypothetical protein BCR36DRAFT_375961 [Piromyces finnis]|eukprot:ORX33539.1 hypothetical protein BCR36DRAFT_375961 [Piromyces finnis]
MFLLHHNMIIIIPTVILLIILKIVASQCHQLQTCKILFDNSNPTYSLIKDDSNDNLYFIVSLNNNIHAFQLKNNNGQYIMNSYDNESLNDLNDIIQGYGKSSEYTSNSAFIKGDDISIIPDCGIILTTRNILPTYSFSILLYF